MKIGIVASNFIKMPPTTESVPKGQSGAAENIIWQLTEKLVEHGEDVTLFCSGDTKTKAKKVAISKLATSQVEGMGPKKTIDYEYWLISEAMSWVRKEKPDIVHSHLPLRTAIFAQNFSCPIVATLHSPLEKEGRYFLSKNQYYVAISNSQRNSLPGLNYVATIYHGVDVKRSEFSITGGDEFSFIARIVPQKGLHVALKAAKKLKFIMNIFGSVPENCQQYWDEKIVPLKNSHNFYGFRDKKQIQQILKKSRALLFPIERDEAFGLAMVESMACGTPVIAFEIGATNEIIINGKNGFLIRPGDVLGFIHAIENIQNMPTDDYQKMRLFCRKYVENKFSVEIMAKQYKAVYQSIAKK